MGGASILGIGSGGVYSNVNKEGKAEGTVLSTSFASVLHNLRLFWGLVSVALFGWNASGWRGLRFRASCGFWLLCFGVSGCFGHWGSRA